MDLASPALLWLLAGLGALIVELLTGSYVLLAMALAAAITAGAAWLGLGLVGQLGVLALSCGVLVPLAIRQLRRRQRSRPFGVAGTGGGSGRRFVLVRRDFDGASCIKLDGDLFRARREGDEAAEAALRPGDEVVLLRFEGTQAIVRPTDAKA